MLKLIGSGLMLLASMTSALKLRSSSLSSYNTWESNDLDWDEVWSYQEELGWDNRTWCNLTIANFTGSYDYYGTGWGSDVDFNNRTWCNETTLNGTDWNNGTCADGACEHGDWYNNTCTDGTWVTLDSEWGPYTTCYQASANITQVLEDPEHAQCGSRINYNDDSILNDEGYGCGDYAQNHESWCGEYGSPLGDGGWGKSECCRCQEWWVPTAPSHYGYWDLPENQISDNSTSGDDVWGSNDTTWGNSTEWGAAPITPYADLFSGGWGYEMHWDNRTWCNLTAANFTEDYYGTGWGLDIDWSNRTWCDSNNSSNSTDGATWGNNTDSW